MKKRTVLRSVAALALAVVLALALALPAFAAGSNQIVITAPADEPGGDGRFEAYQVFKGALVAGEKDEINGIEWGSGVDSEKLLAALKSSAEPVGSNFTSAYDEYETTYKDQMKPAEFVAQWLGERSESYKGTYNPYADAFARAVAASLSTEKKTSTKSGNDWTIEVDDPGYYLVKDTYTGTAASVSSYILRVLGKANVAIKASIPTVTKKVEGQDGYLTGTNSKLTYTLTGTVSKNIGEYSTYAYKFVDELDPGLTADLDSVQVKLSAKGLSQPVTLDNAADTGYTKTLTPNGTAKEEHTLTVEFTDLLKAIKDEAPGLVLTDQDVATSIEITVSYQAVLNEYAVMGSAGNPNEVTLTYSNDPYITSTGVTAPDEVNTYGIGLQIKKVDEKGTPLTGIQFKLQNEDDQYAAFKETTDNNETYYAITGWGSDGTSSVLTTGEGGIINIHGLDVGTYTLTETKTNDGLELMQPIVFNITSDAEGKGHVKDDGSFPNNVTFALDNSDVHRQDVTVENNDFANHHAQVKLTNYPLPILPHTGGMGAKVVYLVSGLTVLVGAAIVVMAMRKRTRGRHEQSR